MAEINRRQMLTIAAGAAVATVGQLTRRTDDLAAAVPSIDQAQVFVALSVALTGVDQAHLAPRVDPIGVRHTYLERAAKDPAFTRLLDVYTAQKDAGLKDEAIAEAIVRHTDKDIRYLAQSVLLMWYLGVWYEPRDLEDFAPSQWQKSTSAPPALATIPFEVLSVGTYTQGWVWRIAQAHPMGYSEQQFGYWAAKPPFELSAFMVNGESK